MFAVPHYSQSFVHVKSKIIFLLFLTSTRWRFYYNCKLLSIKVAYKWLAWCNISSNVILIVDLTRIKIEFTRILKLKSAEN